jgi:hypothetical protein
MKPLATALAAMIVALAAVETRAQRGPCAGGGSAARMSETANPLTTSVGAELASRFVQQAQLQELARRQQMQQTYYAQQLEAQRQYLAQQQSLADEKREARERKLEARKERRLAEEARRAAAKEKQLARRTLETKIAAQK